MAAALARGRLGLQCFSVHLWKSCVRHESKSYYVLLPEIPPDTAETNAVMRTDQLPQFSQITPSKCVSACAKLAIEYETNLANHVESLKDLKKAKSFESVYCPLEESTVTLNTAWATIKNLHYVFSTQDFPKTFARVHQQVERAKNERWVNETLYYAFKELHSDTANLTEYQQRLVDMYLLEGKLNGIALSAAERDRLVNFARTIRVESRNFKNKVVLSQDMFSHDVTDFSCLEEMPWPLLVQMSRDRDNPTRGPWRATLQPANFQSMMAYCSDRSIRWNILNAYNNRAAHMHASKYLNNNNIIEDLRSYRHDLAKLLGYKNFAEMSMETKMANSVENVLSMIETLRCRFSPVVSEEMAQLQEFAESEGFKYELQEWDISYWHRRHCNHLYGIKKDQVSEYFPVNTVLLGLFDLCTKLFGVNFEEVTPQVDVWHSDVRFFNIVDSNGKHISSFYFDPFARPEKSTSAFMEIGRDRSDLVGTRPYSYLSLKIPRPPSASDPALMRFTDVQNLFQEFGHGLQQLLTTVPYSEISGQKNIEWDAVRVCSKFMLQWLTVPSVVKSVSGHYQTGEAIPDDLLSKMLKSSNYGYNLELMYQLFLSAYDMEIYMTKTHWKLIKDQLWDSYMPIPLDEKNCFPCSLTTIFCEMYPAAFYSFVWSEMIAADVFAAFKEVGLDNDNEIKAVGRRFRETYLSLGGGVAATEVFRRFRGRDPSIEVLQPKRLLS
uniref:oligopeptidase A n=1 Tax=Arion vulgaris TaxID=1028688 RepID=A0A0B7A5S5_9EUPU